MPRLHLRGLLFVLLACACTHRREDVALGEPGAGSVAASPDMVRVGVHAPSGSPTHEGSHLIEITRTEIRRVMYRGEQLPNDVLEDRRAPIDPSVFVELVARLSRRGKPLPPPPSPDDVCTEGPTYMVVAERDDTIVVDGWVEDCHGDDGDTLGGATVAFVRKVERIADAHLGRY